MELVFSPHGVLFFFPRSTPFFFFEESRMGKETLHHRVESRFSRLS